MATIRRYPQRFLDEHAQWHQTMMMNMGPGMGSEFLEFHRNFIRKSLRWYKRQGRNASRVAAWTSIPTEIKEHPAWHPGLEMAEFQITQNLASFSSADELGMFLLNSNLHDSIHVLGADVFNDSDFGQIALAPRSTLFYNWHRLIDNWWTAWERMNRDASN